MKKKQATKAQRDPSADPGSEGHSEEEEVAPKPGSRSKQTTKAAALEQPEPPAKRRRPEPGSLATKALEREVYTAQPQNHGGKGSIRNSERLNAASKQRGKDPASTKLQASVPKPKHKKPGAAAADMAERPAAHKEHRWYEQNDDVAYPGTSKHNSKQQGGTMQQQQPVQQPTRPGTRSRNAATAKERQPARTPPSSRQKALMKDVFADEEEAELDSQPPMAAPQQPLLGRQPAGTRGTAGAASPCAPAARAAGRARPGLSTGAGAAALIAGTATAAAAAPRSEAPGGAAQRQRSPTPVAAAAVLEVSQPPSPRHDGSAELAEPGGEQVTVEDAVTAAHSLLLSRLRNPRGREALSTQLRPQLQRVHDQMLEYLDNTVELAHNNSVLLLGPRGSGKTLVIERAVGALCAKWNTNPRDPLVGVVRLLGYAHSDDRVAFREIARQLCEEFQYTFSKSVSLKDNIEFLREMLKQLARAHKAAVFVLEEFDLFAKRTKQAVLYNLLDALVTSGMQAAVIGVTTRQDVIEMLEKRVKSRFSHRKLDVVLPTGTSPRQLEGPGGSIVEEDGMLDVLKAMLLLPPSFPDSQHAQRFNRAVEAAVAAPEVAAALGRVMPACPALDDLAIAVESALRASSDGSGLVTARQLVEGLRRLQERQRDMIFAIAQLPVLDLILLAAMQRLVGSGKVDALNFEMAYHEFHRYTSLGGHADNYTKAAAAKAFDHLITQGLVAYVDARNEARGGAARQYAAVYLQVRPQEVEAGMLDHWNCPHNLKAWMTRHGGTGTTAATVLL